MLDWHGLFRYGLKKVAYLNKYGLPPHAHRGLLHAVFYAGENPV